MDPILNALFTALARMARAGPGYAARLHLHFVGTNYAPPERTAKLVEPLARRHALEQRVHECSTRIPYFEALALNEESDGLLLVGSSSADYTASKLFNCILSKKPILALFHRHSMVVDMARRFPNEPVRILGFIAPDPVNAPTVTQALRLSRARADRVAAELASLGVARDRIQVRGRGTGQVVDVPLEARRVEIHIGPN